MQTTAAPRWRAVSGPPASDWGRAGWWQRGLREPAGPGLPSLTRGAPAGLRFLLDPSQASPVHRRCVSGQPGDATSSQSPEPSRSHIKDWQGHCRLLHQGRWDRPPREGRERSEGHSYRHRPRWGLLGLGTEPGPGHSARPASLPHSSPLGASLSQAGPLSAGLLLSGAPGAGAAPGVGAAARNSFFSEGRRQSGHPGDSCRPHLLCGHPEGTRQWGWTFGGEHLCPQGCQQGADGMPATSSEPRFPGGGA